MQTYLKKIELHIAFVDSEIVGHDLSRGAKEPNPGVHLTTLRNVVRKKRDPP